MTSLLKIIATGKIHDYKIVIVFFTYYIYMFGIMFRTMFLCYFFNCSVLYVD